LGCYLASDARDVAFQLGPQEKPELAPLVAPRLEFNISHSGDAALFAFASARRVGVDIESIRSHSDLDGLARQVFSSAEIDKLSRSPEEQKEDFFFTVWAKKEAFIKALGLGFSAPLREITVADGLIAFDAKSGISFLDAYEACWSLVSLPVPAGYKAALAVEGVLTSDLLLLRPLQPSIGSL
jgi:4'-phosphopantetheinyl transferase